MKASFGVGVGRELWLRGFVSSSAQPGSGLSPIMALHAVVGTVLPTNKRPVFFQPRIFPSFSTFTISIPYYSNGHNSTISYQKGEI